MVFALQKETDKYTWQNFFSIVNDNPSKNPCILSYSYLMLIVCHGCWLNALAVLKFLVFNICIFLFPKIEENEKR